MVWRLLGYVFSILMNRLAKGEIPVLDRVIHISAQGGKQLAVMLGSGLVFGLGLAAFLADLLISTNLRGDGDLRLSQVSLIAFFTMAFGTYGMYRGSQGIQRLRDEYRPEPEYNPIQELMLEVLREARTYVHQMAENSEETPGKRPVQEPPLTPPIEAPQAPPLMPPKPRIDDPRIFQTQSTNYINGRM